LEAYYLKVAMNTIYRRQNEPDVFYRLCLRDANGKIHQLNTKDNKFSMGGLARGNYELILANEVSEITLCRLCVEYD